MNVIGISGLPNSVSFKKKMFQELSSREYRITQGFDSAAALVTLSGVAAAAAEERFTRKKATEAFPVNAIRSCLRTSNLEPADIHYIAHGFNYEPFRSFYQNSDTARRQYAEVYSKEALTRCIEEYLPSYGWSDKLIQVEHHLAHAASTFYLSGFDESLIFITDGMGEQHSTTIAVGSGSEITVVRQIQSLHSLGILYGLLTLYLGFSFALDEYKVMGLAPYGDPKRHFDRFMSLITLKNDGTYSIPVLFQNRTETDKESYRGTLRLLEEMFGPSRQPDAEITQNHMDIASALQSALQATVMHVLRHFKNETGLSNLCMAGGVALNCTANGVIKRSRLFRNVFIQPAAGDDGSALGAALYVQRLHEPNLRFDRMTLPLWGPSFSDEEIQGALEEERGCESTYFHCLADLLKDVAARLAEGQIIAWFQGRMEFGPRALGNRSILADPRDADMKDRVNELIKKREWFRPFAPAVTAEAATRIFDVGCGEEALYGHMLLVTQVRSEFREQLPAVTHVDGSARVQVVIRADNPRFWELLREFERVGGIPVLLNTSFNVRGQPIVCTPKEAISTFLLAKLDALAIGNHLVVAQRSRA